MIELYYPLSFAPSDVVSSLTIKTEIARRIAQDFFADELAGRYDPARASVRRAEVR
jgi:hypothetical protein